MFKRKIRKQIAELQTKVDDLERKYKELELDLQLYVRKLKVSKGVMKEREEEKDIKTNMLLPE
ncbi:unnamed protein product [marine sediment metagenome]|uniref:Uncharacterized protein n=1 Tax=marine sediment metagenome TaxID=412755 RepID=X1L7W7_9ZZZZ